MAGLLGSQQISSAANLQILESDSVPRTQISMMLEYPQPFLGIGLDAVGDQEIAVRPSMAAPDPPAELIQLSQTEAMSVVHNHGIGIGHIQAGFHDHGGDENVYLARHETAHDLL